MITAADTIEYCAVDSDQYPGRLRIIPDPPTGLYYRGSIDAINESGCIAVIGTRNASKHGMDTAYHIGKLAAENGFIVVNGLALGIDTAAIRGALDAGGKVTAILPCGLDQIVPYSNRDLAREILEKDGCLISEYPAGTAPQKYSYVQRDRLQSGISGGIIIVEADEKSGTMHTARYALKQSRRLACYYSTLLGTDSGNRALISADKAQSLQTDQDILNFINNEEPIIEYKQLSLF